MGGGTDPGRAQRRSREHDRAHIGISSPRVGRVDGDSRPRASLRDGYLPVSIGALGFQTRFLRPTSGARSTRPRIGVRVESTFVAAMTTEEVVSWRIGDPEEMATVQLFITDM
jgi:hypothetical protein